jgi:hypothetical protein
MENAKFVREEAQAVTEIRYDSIQKELQGRVDVARRREDARLKVIADAEKEAIRKVEGERRRAALEWKRNAPRRAAEAAANAEAERKAIYHARQTAALAIRKQEEEAEKQLLQYGEFGVSQAAKDEQMRRSREQHARRKKHSSWLKEKLARDDAKKKLARAEEKQSGRALTDENVPATGPATVVAKDRSALHQHAVQQRRRKTQARQRLVKRLKKEGSIKDVFSEMDADNSGDVSFREFTVSCITHITYEF